VNEQPSLIRRVDGSGLPLLLARLLLGGMFVFLGAAKLSDPIEFRKQIRQFHILPEEPGIALNSVAIVLPWLEVLCGSALILGARLRGAALLVALMLAAFTPAIFYRTMSIRAEKGTPFLEIAFNCGCGTGEVIAWQKLLENTGLFVLALYALFSRARRFGEARPTTAPVAIIPDVAAPADMEQERDRSGHVNAVSA